MNVDTERCRPSTLETAMLLRSFIQSKIAGRSLRNVSLRKDVDRIPASSCNEFHDPAGGRYGVLRLQ